MLSYFGALDVTGMEICAGKIKFTIKAMLKKQENVTTEFADTFRKVDLNKLLPWNVSTNCNPQISKIYPTYGPQSGGTFLTIYGKNFNIEKEISIHIGDAKCYLVERKAHYISCLTPNLTTNASDAFETNVLLEWFKTNTYARQKQAINDLRNNGIKFTYKVDPVIHAVEPEESILSGGILITALGSHLDSVAEPQMVVTVVTPGGANVYYQVSKYVSMKIHCMGGSIFNNILAKVIACIMYVACLLLFNAM